MKWTSILRAKPLRRKHPSKNSSPAPGRAMLAGRRWLRTNIVNELSSSPNVVEEQRMSIHLELGNHFWNICMKIWASRGPPHTIRSGSQAALPHVKSFKEVFSEKSGGLLS